MSEREPQDPRSRLLGARDFAFALALAFLAALILLPGLFGGGVGKAITGAVRILDGEVPYRDFWTMYAPGMYYATAGVFRLFGQDLLPLGIVSLLLDALIIGATFLLLWRLTHSRPVAVVLAFVFIGAFWATGREIASYEPALFFLILSWHGILGYLHGGGRMRLVGAGLLAGMAAWFKHDVAAYVVLAAVASLFLSWLLAGERRPSHWVHPVRSTLYLAAGALATFLPAAAWIAWLAGADAWQDVFVFPATTFSKVMTPSYPPWCPPLHALWELLWDSSPEAAYWTLSALSDWTLCHVPQYVFVVTVFVVIRWRRSLEPPALATILMFLGAIPFFWSAAHLQRNTHVYSMALIGFLLGSMAWSGLRRSTKHVRWARCGLVLGCALVAVGLWLPTAMNMYRFWMQWRDNQLLELPGMRARYYPSHIFDAYLPIVEFLQKNTREDERIYVGLARHDSIVINDWSLHTVAGRRNCCRYSELHRGVADVVEGQREIIRDIERHQVRAVVLWKFGWSDEILERRLEGLRLRLPEAGSVVLDEYIAEHFDLLAQHGEYLVMWRKGIPKPKHD